MRSAYLELASVCQTYAYCLHQSRTGLYANLERVLTHRATLRAHVYVECTPARAPHARTQGHMCKNVRRHVHLHTYTCARTCARAYTVNMSTCCGIGELCAAELLGSRSNSSRQTSRAAGNRVGIGCYALRLQGDTKFCTPAWIRTGW